MTSCITVFYNSFSFSITSSSFVLQQVLTSCLASLVPFCSSVLFSNCLVLEAWKWIPGWSLRREAYKSERQKNWSWSREEDTSTHWRKTTFRFAAKWAPSVFSRRPSSCLSYRLPKWRTDKCWHAASKCFNCVPAKMANFSWPIPTWCAQVKMRIAFVDNSPKTTENFLHGPLGRRNRPHL